MIRINYKYKNRYTNIKRGRNFDDPKYVKWRRSIYKRDKYRCQMPGCKYRGKFIEAHHIVKWSDSIDLRFEISNGITLCRRCHKRVSGYENIYKTLFHVILKKNEQLSTTNNKRYKRKK